MLLSRGSWQHLYEFVACYTLQHGNSQDLCRVRKFLHDGCGLRVPALPLWHKPAYSPYQHVPKVVVYSPFSSHLLTL